jgi:hypothetical protein
MQFMNLFLNTRMRAIGSSKCQGGCWRYVESHFFMAKGLSQGLYVYIVHATTPAVFLK